MRPVIATIPAEQLGWPPLVRDFLDASSDVLVGRLGRAGDVLENAKRDAGRRVDEALCAALVGENAELGASDELLDRLGAASRGRVHFVVTGQQPGALGGPLMTLHKVATAESLARRVEQETGEPAVALYWMGADDDDFAEIRGWVSALGDLSPVEASLHGGHHQVGLPVGSIPARADADVWEAVAPVVEAMRENAAGSVGRAIAESSDHGEMVARLISGVFGGRVAVVDGRSQAVRTAARETILAFVDRHREVEDAVARGGDALRASGYHAQLESGGEFAGVFLLENGRRVKIPVEQVSRFREQFASDPALASPGVVLRSVVQDAVFSPDAVVLGPAEIAYRAQVADAYETLGVVRPAVFPRMSGTFVPRFVADRFGAAASELALDPRGAVVHLLAREIDAKLTDAADELVQSTEEALATWVARTGKPVNRKARGRVEDVRKRVRRVADAALEDARAAVIAEAPWLAHVETFFIRRGVPQERYLWMLAPEFLVGDTMASIRTASDAHVAAALDGAAGHIVYCA